MATLRVVQSIVNDDYVLVFSIDPASISDDDYKRIRKFGAPLINFGGSFTNGTDITYSLPDCFISLPSDFPVTQTFSVVAPFNSNTINKLTLYRTTIATAINTAFTTLRTTADTFTGEFVTNI